MVKTQALHCIFLCAYEHVNLQLQYLLNAQPGGVGRGHFLPYFFYFRQFGIKLRDFFLLFCQFI